MSQNRTYIWLIVLAIIVVGLGGCLYYVQTFFLPALVEKEILHALRERGLPEATVQVKRVTWRQTELSDLRLGNSGELAMGRILVDYSLASLRQRRVESIKIADASWRVIIRDNSVDFGTLAHYRSEGPATLPFERLKLESSGVQLDWEGRQVEFIVDGSLTPVTADSAAIELRAKLDDSRFHLEANANVNSSDGEMELVIDHLNSQWLERLCASILPELRLTNHGFLRAEARAKRADTTWTAAVTVQSEDWQIDYELGSPRTQLAISVVNADLQLHSNGMTAIKLQSLVNRTPLRCEAQGNWRSQSFSGSLQLTGIDGKRWNELTRAYLPATPIDFSGRTSLEGRWKFQRGRASGEVTLNGSNLAVHYGTGASAMQISPSKFNVQFEMIRMADAIRIDRLVSRLEHCNVVLDSLGVKASGINARIPFNWAEQRIDSAAFSVAGITWDTFELPAWSGTLHADGSQLRWHADSELLPGARLALDGRLQYAGEARNGDMQAVIPAFALQDKRSLAKYLALFPNSEISGTFALIAGMNWNADVTSSQARLDMTEVSWQSNLSESRLDGIAGSLQIDDLQQLRSAGRQRLRFESARFGSLEVTAGEIVYQLVGVDSILIDSLQCRWAGGTLSCYQVPLRPSREEVSFELIAENLDLQAILDFVQYDGVTGQGKIYGHLPVTFKFGNKKRLKFGNGYLESRPQRGILQLSKENAQAILGIKKEIDPKKATLEETVSLMVINALQDMEYTNLRFVFKNEEAKGWMTYVQAQGQGPRSDPQNRIPIGGFNVNINHLDELLNSLLWTELGSGTLKLN